MKQFKTQTSIQSKRSVSIDRAIIGCILWGQTEDLSDKHVQDSDDHFGGSSYFNYCLILILMLQ